MDGPSSAPLTLVAFGDSITLASEQPVDSRWPTLVRGRLEEALPSRSIRVINAGVGGNTSREGLRRIETDVLRHEPDIVTVEFGGNDATPDPDRHVTLEEYRTNLSRMLERILEIPGATIVLLPFPPLVDAWHAWKDDALFREHGGPDGFIERYRAVTREFAATHAIPLAAIDRALRGTMDREGAGACLMPDGVHLTARGNEVVAREVTRTLMEVMGPP